MNKFLHFVKLNKKLIAAVLTAALTAAGVPVYIASTASTVAVESVDQIEVPAE